LINEAQRHRSSTAATADLTDAPPTDGPTEGPADDDEETPLSCDAGTQSDTRFSSASTSTQTDRTGKSKGKFDLIL